MRSPALSSSPAREPIDRCAGGVMNLPQVLLPGWNGNPSCRRQHRLSWGRWAWARPP